MDITYTATQPAGSIEQNTENFTQLLERGAFTGDFFGAFNAAYPIISLVFMFIALLGVAIVVAICLRVTCDILIIAMPSIASGENRVTGFIYKMSSFSRGDSDYSLKGWAKNHLVSLIMTLVFAGLIVTGQLMPVIASLVSTFAEIAHELVEAFKGLFDGNSPQLPGTVNDGSSVNN